MAYADFTYYTDTYLGTAIVTGDFAALALRASAVLDQISFGRIEVIVTAATDTATIDKIKMAMCAVAEEIQAQNVAEAAGEIDGIQSESIGNHSVTYAASSSRLMTSEDKLFNSARLWLANTGLLFQGFASGEYGGVLEDDN